jgi:hypothetical protein
MLVAVRMNFELLMNNEIISHNSVNSKVELED